MHCVTTLVVDDQPVLRYAVRQLLRDHAGVRAVAEAGTEREALRQCELLTPSRPGRFEIPQRSKSGCDIVPSIA